MNKEILIYILVIVYVVLALVGLYFFIKDIFTSRIGRHRFDPVIRNAIQSKIFIPPKQFFDIAEGCRLPRLMAIKRLKYLLSEFKDEFEISFLQRIIDGVEDYEPIRTSKVGLLANLAALESAMKNDPLLSQHFIAVKNEISSLSSKFLEFERNKRFNILVGWLSIFGFLFGGYGLWLSVTAPNAQQIAIEINKLQSGVK